MANSNSNFHNRLQFKDVIAFIKPFDGTKEKYKFFIHGCDMAIATAEKHEIPISCILNYITVKLGELECEFVLSHNFSNWYDLKKMCDRHFGVKELQLINLVRDLCNIKQGNLSVFKYYSEVKMIVFNYNTILKNQYRTDDSLYKAGLILIDSLALQAFENGLREDIRKAVILQNPKTLLDIYQLAQVFEDKESNLINIIDADNLVMSNSNLVDSTPSIKNPEVGYQENIESCQICHKTGHFANICYFRNSNDNCNNFVENNKNHINNFGNNYPQFAKNIEFQYHNRITPRSKKR